MDNKKILVYTRKPDKDGYTASLANSIHMAYSTDGTSYQPLNQNYGILFASATISSRNTINEKGIINPYLFRTAEGTYGIVAIRVSAGGVEDEESKGGILLFLSSDLIHFTECGILNVNKEVFVQKVICEYNKMNKIYEITWCDTEANYYQNKIQNLQKPEQMSMPIEAVPFVNETSVSDLKDILHGNILTVEEELAKEFLLHWTCIKNIDIKMPDSIQVASKHELESTMATAIYSDGSTSYKKVIWDTKMIDFTKSGTYKIQGEVVQESYPFPLAVGYADPVVLPWQRKYYFIATNDNTDDVGLFVREAHTVADLFKEGIQEYNILDFNPEKQLIQTFWAPEFHIIHDDLYILFAVSGEAWSPQSHVMKLKKGGSILKSEDWENPIRVKKMDGTYLTENGITLDMTYFTIDENSYLVWSYRFGIGTPDDTGSMLYIATVDPVTPWVLTCEPVLLSRPLLGWENIDGTINNEGPYPLITDEYVHIAYSGGSACGYSYAVGLLSIKRGKNLLKAEEWSKLSTPLLSYYSDRREYGPGHNSFYTEENGQVMIAYHAKETIENTPRCTAIRRVHFNNKGFPVFDLSEERDLDEKLKQISINVNIKEKEQ